MTRVPRISHYLLKTGSEGAEESSQDSSSQFANRSVPTFYVENSVKKWREMRVEVLRINCAKEDAEFLKFLLSSASEQQLFTRGEFVPEGLQLMANSELVHSILVEQKKYIENITSIPLSGLTREDLLKNTTDNKKQVKDLILIIDGVHSIERVSERKSPGRWSVLVEKEITADRILSK